MSKSTNSQNSPNTIIQQPFDGSNLKSSCLNPQQGCHSHVPQPAIRHGAKAVTTPRAKPIKPDTTPRAKPTEPNIAPQVQIPADSGNSLHGRYAQTLDLVFIGLMLLLVFALIIYQIGVVVQETIRNKRRN